MINVKEASRPATAVHLIVDGKGAPGLVLEVPPGVSRLHAGEGENPCLARTGSKGPRILVEPVHRGGRLNLLVANAGSERLDVNDQRAPAAVLLRECDQLRVAGGSALEVAIYQCPTIGLPDREMLDAGARCGLCRTPLSAESRISVCALCGGAMHFDGGDDPGALKCAELARTCTCGHPVRLTEGYLREPSFLGKGAE